MGMASSDPAFQEFGLKRNADAMDDADETLDDDRGASVSQGNSAVPKPKTERLSRAQQKKRNARERKRQKKAENAQAQSTQEPQATAVVQSRPRLSAAALAAAYEKTGGKSQEADVCEVSDDDDAPEEDPMTAMMKELGLPCGFRGP